MGDRLCEAAAKDLVQKLSAEHEQRLARWAAAAVPDPGINLKRQVIGWRGPPSARPREPEPPPPELPPEPARLLPETKAQLIIRAVCERFAIRLDEIRGRNRERRVMVPRHIAMALLREVTHLSLPQIGRALGGLDHTTVMSGIKRIANRRASNPLFATYFDELKVKLSEPEGR